MFRNQYKGILIFKTRILLLSSQIIFGNGNTKHSLLECRPKFERFSIFDRFSITTRFLIVVLIIGSLCLEKLVMSGLVVPTTSGCLINLSQACYSQLKTLCGVFFYLHFLFFKDFLFIQRYIQKIFHDSKICFKVIIFLL